MRKNELKGEKIGLWTVGDSISKNGKIYFHCTCKCGKESDIQSSVLNKGKSLSCQSCSKLGKGKDHTGEKYGHLVVLGKKVINKRTLWECRCDCGNTKLFQTNHLTHVTSCGCRPEVGEHIKEKIKKHCENGTYIPGLTRNTVNKNNTTGIKGVSFRPERGKYRAYIKFQRKNIHLGTFDTLEEAAFARKEAEKYYFGDYMENK